jgi:PhzF family phenazine biosynthesis protein
MGIKVYHVDAFASSPFAGNPAAVCLLPKPFDDAWMLGLAREFNLSETAFLVRIGDEFQLRWFTPKVEVELCGHATLASAHVLWETGELKQGQVVRFRTRAGPLSARLHGGWIEMNFPEEPESPCKAPPALLEALGVTPKYVGRNRFDYLVEVEDEDVVRRLKPDFVKLAESTNRGVIVTSTSCSDDYDFVSRFFAPAVGVDEDPVTGSSHCCLAPYWMKRLRRRELTGYQASSRGGIVKTKVLKERVLLMGKAITIMAGELVV